MSLVLGKNVTVFVYDPVAVAWLPYACARSCTITPSTSTLETSITGAGKFRTFIAEANSFTGSLEGIMSLLESGKVTIAELITMQLAHTPIMLRFEYIDEDTNVFTMEGFYIITSAPITTSFDNITTFSVELQGTGPLTLIYTVTPAPGNGRMNRKEYVLEMGDSFVIIPELIGIDPVNLINVELDLGCYPIIITSGTPVGQEVKFTQATGRLDFPGANPDTDLNGHVEYQTI